MNKTDLDYGKVLVTGEIAFLMHHPKGRMITEENKNKFVKKWISNRIKKKKDRSDVRKMLQHVKGNLRCSQIWTKNLNSYLQHIDNCKKIKALGKTDRELVEEAILKMRSLGFHAKSGISPETEFTEEETKAFSEKGAFLMMDILENRFDENGMLKKNVDLEIIATNQNVIKNAIQVFLLKSFPLKCADRQDIFAVGSPNGQINTTLSGLS